LNIELKKAIPNAKGFNHQNLRYAEKFYTKYKKIFPQVVGELLQDRSNKKGSSNSKVE